MKNNRKNILGLIPLLKWVSESMDLKMTYGELSDHATSLQTDVKHGYPNRMTKNDGSFKAINTAVINTTMLFQGLNQIPEKEVFFLKPLILGIPKTSHCLTSVDFKDR